MKIKNNLFKKSNWGLVINWNFHKKNKWVSAISPYLVKAILKEFNPIIITSQLEYEIHKKKLMYIISMEPGWAAPKIRYDKKQEQIIGVFISDPHNKKDWLERFVEKNNIKYIFSYYESPFFYHFPNFPKGKFIHMPWAIPDELIFNHNIKNQKKDEVVIFGGSSSDAYDIRNWCRNQKGVINYDNSGVENKKMTDEEYFKWLSGFDAIIAAGSSNSKYDLVTPKYFEIASAGALLFGQDCIDLKNLGFNNKNSIIFNKDNFLDKLKIYKKNPSKFIKIRENSRDLILRRHKISDRIKLIRRVFKN